MGKRLTGGYKIIPIGVDLALASASVEIAGLYASIKSTKKRIVLAGLKINGELQNDIAVKVDEDENGLKISDVYGYDLAISENDALTVSEHVAPSGGGTKLYKHDLVISDADGESRLRGISSQSSPYTVNNMLSNVSSGQLIINLMLNINEFDKTILKFNADDTYTLYIIEKSYIVTELSDEEGAITLTDTVTEF